MTAISTTSRAQALDALRGFAMAWMTAYHFCFDLNHFGWMRQDFYNDAFWTWQRSAIVGLFLFCVGCSQALSHKASQGFAIRWLQIAGCALLVSASSYIMYPKSYIYFGVLHAICVMLLMLRVMKHLDQWLWLVGAACLAVFYSPPFIANATPWNILGLISQKPITEDYVPLLPWFAMVCFGYAFGQRWIKEGWHSSVHPLLKSLSVLGQYSLIYYMLHQPILIGLLYLCRLA
jgi:uncharacterized membrane protein